MNDNRHSNRLVLVERAMSFFPVTSNSVRSIVYEITSPFARGRCVCRPQLVNAPGLSGGSFIFSPHTRGSCSRLPRFARGVPLRELEPSARARRLVSWNEEVVS